MFSAASLFAAVVCAYAYGVLVFAMRFVPQVVGAAITSQARFGHGFTVTIHTYADTVVVCANVHMQEQESNNSTEDASLGMTVYTMRLTTGFARGAALSDPCSGVNICLVGRDGRGILHRISPVNDPIESRAHTEEICEVRGAWHGGAACEHAWRVS